MIVERKLPRSQLTDDGRGLSVPLAGCLELHRDRDDPPDVVRPKVDGCGGAQHVKSPADDDSIEPEARLADTYDVRR